MQTKLKLNTNKISMTGQTQFNFNKTGQCIPPKITVAYATERKGRSPFSVIKSSLYYLLKGVK